MFTTADVYAFERERESSMPTSQRLKAEVKMEQESDSNFRCCATPDY